MTCHEFDWKAFVLDEVSAADREGGERHLAACPRCVETVHQLQLTLATLNRLPQVEPPRRISFVSDPVLAPSWWRRLWYSGPQLGFASAALLSLAILAGSWMVRIAPRETAPSFAGQPAVTDAQLEERIRSEVARRLPALLEQARKENDAALARVLGLEKRLTDQRRQDIRDVRESFGYLERQLGALYRNTSQVGGD
jgi:hypothetical protein